MEEYGERLNITCTMMVHGVQRQEVLQSTTRDMQQAIATFEGRIEDCHT